MLYQPQCYKCQRFVPVWRADVHYDFEYGWEEWYTTCSACDGIPDEDHWRYPRQPHLPRNRGKVATVDGLTTVGQEDTPSE